MTAGTGDIFDVFSVGRSAGTSNHNCEWPGCAVAGEHRAPKSRANLREYHWFCLEHVRCYNKAWNFCAGMTNTELEALIRSDTTWNRPSWPLGGASDAFSADPIRRLMEAFAESGGLFDEAARVRTGPETAAERALAVLELNRPVDAAVLKSRYKALVKRHHPDANGGTKASEEKFKEITRAYETLMTMLAA